MKKNDLFYIDTFKASLFPVQNDLEKNQGTLQKIKIFFRYLP